MQNDNGVPENSGIPQQEIEVDKENQSAAVPPVVSAVPESVVPVFGQDAAEELSFTEHASVPEGMTDELTHIQETRIEAHTHGEAGQSPAATPHEETVRSSQEDGQVSPPVSQVSSSANEEPAGHEPHDREGMAEKIIPAPVSEHEKEKIFRDRLRDLSVKGNIARTKIHQQNLQKIIAHLRQHGYIANDQVEELCGVGNTAAWKLLKELEQGGTLMRIGNHGPLVRYRLREAVQI